MRPIPFQTLSPFGNPRLRRPRPERAHARPDARPGRGAFGSAAGQGFLPGASGPRR